MTRDREGRAGSRAAFLAVALLALIPGLGFSEEPSPPESADLVILLDASQSVLPYFKDVTDFVVGPLLRSYLRRGDDFHLLSFGDKAQLEIARRIESEEDLKAALGSLYLVSPLASGTDLLGALNFLSNYLAGLSQAKPKTVVLITDGLHNPPKAQAPSPPGPEEIKADIERAAGVFRGKGWTVRIVKLPFGPEGQAAAGPEGSSTRQAAAGSSGGPLLPPPSSTAAGSAVPALPSTPSGRAAPTAPSPSPKTAGDRSSAAARAGAAQSTAPSAAGSQAAGGSGASASQAADGSGAAGSQAAGESGTAAPTQAGALPSALAGSEKAGSASPDRGSAEAETFVEEAANAFGAELGEFRPEDGPESSLRSLALPELIFPGHLGRRGSRFAFPLEVRNPSASPLRLELEAALHDGQNILARPASISLKPGSTGRLRVSILVPPELGPGEHSLELELGFRSGQRLLNRSGSIAFELVAASEAPNLLRIPLCALALLALALALFLAIRRFRQRRKAPLLSALDGGRRPGRASAPPPPSSAKAGGRPETDRGRGLPLKASAPEGRLPPSPRRSSRPAAPAAARGAAAYVPRIAGAGRVRVELRVAGQNPHIGDRNIHELHAGASKKVGGGRSDFLIFLFRAPRRLAELHYDGEKCHFLPLRPEFFPELEGVLEDCIDKEITLLEPRGRTLILRFRLYESPELRINRLLHCIEAPGIFIV